MVVGIPLIQYTLKFIINRNLIVRLVPKYLSFATL
jgi:hypothetical protein